MIKKALLLVNFGAPRNLGEVKPFLKALLSDQKMIQTPLPAWLHRMIFSLVVNSRVKRVKSEYALMGGFSPLYFETQEMAQEIEKRFNIPTFTFHRYLESTHEETFLKLSQCLADEIVVFPLYPHFSQTTTGSAMACLSHHSFSKKLKWVLSYSTHPSFVELWQKRIKAFLKQKGILEEEVTLLFSAHSLPCRYIERGDRYLDEVKKSVAAISIAFPKAKCRLCFQSKSFRGAWLEPQTKEVVKKTKGKRLLIPISFVMDNIETLVELEKLCSDEVMRVPCFGLCSRWLEIIAGHFAG